MITHITKDTFKNEVLDSNIPVLLDFYADWCGPCRAQGKILEELSSKFEGEIKICKCNVDNNPELASEFQRIKDYMRERTGTYGHLPHCRETKEFFHSISYLSVFKFSLDSCL